MKHPKVEHAKVLFVSQEITPYLPESEMSKIGRYLPQGIQEKGREIRTFMPKFGCINERRNQLHEVIRLSGMNLIIDDTDHPLIIKVASIQSARMQVYFIDNEDYFHRKHVLKNSKGEYFQDNDERVIFFARGVLETVRKLRWSPDIVHCHGWITSLVPLYLRKAYQDDPLYNRSRIIYSVYNDEFDQPLEARFKDKLMMEGIEKEDVSILEKPTFENLTKIALQMSDATILGSKDINKKIVDYIKTINKPVLEYKSEEDYIEAYSEFYDELLTKPIDEN
ncbi:MAG: glycogen/starch synthase [Bacteroidales bacterium]|nr:glycogen/starch synthase [Bacteroidales bacterium]